MGMLRQVLPLDAIPLLVLGIIRKLQDAGHSLEGTSMHLAVAAVVTLVLL